MFSWINYDIEQNDANVRSPKIKCLKRSELCLENTFKLKVQSKTKINKTKNQMKDKNKMICKITDLDPEEREKIAKLIRELGVIEMEKIKISNELNSTRNDYQKQLETLQYGQQILKQEKLKLEEELKVRETIIRSMEAAEKTALFVTKNEEPDLREFADEFLLVPRERIRSSLGPGPPSLANSKTILAELESSSVCSERSTKISSSSCRGDDEESSQRRRQLLTQQKQLRRERRWLETIVQQQQSLQLLSKHVVSLEDAATRTGSEERSCPRGGDPQSSSESGVVSTVTLNRLTDEESNIQSQMSLEVRGKETSCVYERVLDKQHQSTKFAQEEDLLILALNQRKDPPTPKTHHPSISKSHSDPPNPRVSSSNSLFNMIDYLEQTTPPPSTLGSSLSFVDDPHINEATSAEDDILSDLFFSAR